MSPCGAGWGHRVRHKKAPPSSCRETNTHLPRGLEMHLPRRLEMQVYEQCRALAAWTALHLSHESLVCYGAHASNVVRDERAADAGNGGICLCGNRNALVALPRSLALSLSLYLSLLALCLLSLSLYPLLSSLLSFSF